MTCGTLKGAADLMNISHPAVHRLIGDLEYSSGLQLFVREKKRLQPTAEALALYHEVEISFIGLDTLKRKVKEISQFNVGKLRIISISALAVSFLPEIIRRFSVCHPNIGIAVQTHSSAIVAEWIAAQQFDIGLSFGAVDQPGINKRLLTQVPSVCVLPPGHKLANKPVVVPEDLDGECFVSMGVDDFTRIEIDRVFESAGISRTMNIEAHLAGVVCSIVLAGAGVSIVNPFTALDFVNRGLILKPFKPDIIVKFFLTFPAARPKSALADKFVVSIEAYREECLNELRQLSLLD